MGIVETVRNDHAPQRVHGKEEKMNTRILTSVLTIVAVVAAVGVTTYALFSDTETSSDNIFSAGTLDLVLCDEDEGDAPCEEPEPEEDPADSVTASIGDNNMAPGDSTSGFIELRNVGSLEIDDVDLALAAVGTNDPGSNSFLPDVLNMTFMTGDNNTCTGGIDITGAIDDAVGDGVGDLTMSEFNGKTYSALPGLLPDGNYFLCVEVTMDGDAGNIYQGDSATMTLTFTANQVIAP